MSSTIQRSVKVMELLARKSPMGVRAIAGELGVPLGSLHRLLLDLEVEGVVERSATAEWELAYRLFEITGMHLERINYPALVRPFAEKIAEETHETVNLHSFTGLQAMIIDKVRGNEGMQLDFPIGALGVLHAGGAAKAILAYANDEVLQRVLDEPMARMTPYTLTDPADLTAELARVRERGYSIDNQEVVLGVFCVSVPILDRARRPVGAMSISGPSEKAPGPQVMPLVEMLNDACGQVSRKIGYTGEFPLLVPDATAKREAS